MKIRIMHPKIIQQFESDARFQARIHLVGTYFWLFNFPFVGYMFFYRPHAWLAVGLVLNTFYSLYANFSTDYGALSAAQASQKADGHAPATDTTAPWIAPHKKTVAASGTVLSEV